jgi:hypothetical protein
MSRFSGPQFRGASRQARAERRRGPAKKQREVAVLRASDARSCPGKVRYATKELAVGRHTTINAITGENMRAYDCTACGWIHLGHEVGAATGLRHGAGRRESADQ